ncbi:MAG: endolytic transglycosylase MltG, partial [Clostridiaceae bacterium]|nr:endolytic transglycosylase MltG [Clostridiaceae bacterium]
MKLIDGKSVLLGMGLGVIITAMIGFIFFLGYTPQIQDAEIIARARNLGMIDPYESGSDIRRNRDGSLLFTVHEDENFTDVSERLYESGLIESTIEFEIILKKEGLENSIKPGQYTITSEDNTKSIIRK